MPASIRPRACAGLALPAAPRYAGRRVRSRRGGGALSSEADVRREVRLIGTGEEAIVPAGTRHRITSLEGEAARKERSAKANDPAEPDATPSGKSAT